MAEQNPGQPLTDTSYSDPLYDRLERLSHFLGRRWLLVLVAFIATVVAGLFMLEQRRSTPDAASAGRYMQAQEKQEELLAFAQDQAESVEFRARARIELAQMGLQDGASAEALDHVEEALELLEQEDFPGLELSARLSKAAAQTQAGEYEAALDTLRGVEQAAIDHPAHRMQARMDQAFILYQQVEEDVINTEDADAEGGADAPGGQELEPVPVQDDVVLSPEQRAKLERALGLLETVRAANNADIREMAAFLFYRIRYQFPQLQEDADAAADQEVRMSAPEAPSEEADEATADAEAQPDVDAEDAADGAAATGSTADADDGQPAAE
ncbi:MAG: hypothetical protein ACOCXJ_07165 [Planctomycetota bacterium]